MNNYFKYEKDLVNNFIEFKFKQSSKSITTIEVPVRWGNIDIINIKNNYMPFNNEQCNVLARPSNSRVFLKTKSNKGITKKGLMDINGISEATIENCISQLLKVNLITKKDNLYYRNIEFKFPKVVITGYEAKLIDYKKAFFQAMINKEYVDYSYLVFPMDIAKKIMASHSNTLSENCIGLIGVSDKKQKTLIKAKKLGNLKSYIRLLNIVHSNIQNNYIEKASII